GEHDLAEPYLKKGFALAKEVRNKGQSVMAGVALSQLEVLRGHQEAAVEWLAEAQRLAESLNNIYLRWLVALSRARVDAHAGRVERCAATLQPWRKVAADLDSDELSAAINGVMARAYHQGGKPAEARRSVLKALQIHARRSSPSFDMAQALELAGLVHGALGEAGQSRNAMERALALYEHFGFSLGAERCRRALVV
ncbi:MAG TPA: hypothetical protein VI893_11085, partial [Thermoplasmata archaeon]|nr:hypothetical protein [Thermoplasmata archaeon]